VDRYKKQKFDIGWKVFTYIITLYVFCESQFYKLH